MGLRESSAYHIENLFDIEPDCQVVLLSVAEELEAEISKLKKDAAKIRVEAIKEAATMCCPVSGYVVRDEQARKDLMDWASVIEMVESNQ